MRRTVHVAEQMHQIFDMHQYRRVVELVIFGEQRNRLFDGHDAVALRARRLAHGRRTAKLRIDRSGVPVRRELIAFRTAPLIHPRGVVDDVVVSLEVLGNVLLRLGSHILPSDHRRNVVSQLVPRRGGKGNDKQHERRRKNLLHVSFRLV